MASPTCSAAASSKPCCSQPADYLQQWSPDDADGDFYKIDRAFEFNDGGSLIADPMPRLQVFTTPNLVDGGTMKKTERYRWNWLKRSYEHANDYTNIFALVDALNAAGAGTVHLANRGPGGCGGVDGHFRLRAHHQQLRQLGPRHRQEHVRLQTAPGAMAALRVRPRLADARFARVTPATYTAANGPLFNADDPTVTRMYNHPPFRRAYFRAVQDAVNGPLLSSHCDPVMDAKYASLVANGVTLCDGSSLTDPSALKTWFRDRRTACSTNWQPWRRPSPWLAQRT